MWDGANEVGPTMRPGEYYRLRNVLVKGGRDGYVEGKMSEAKIRKLDAEGEDAADAELKALIRLVMSKRVVCLNLHPFSADFSLTMMRMRTWTTRFP